MDIKQMRDMLRKGEGLGVSHSRPDLAGVVKECAQCGDVHDLGSCPADLFKSSAAREVARDAESALTRAKPIDAAKASEEPEMIDERRLHFTDEKSDKVYIIRIIKRGATLTLEAHWGRRGKTLQSQVKKTTTSLGQVKMAFEELISEKTDKGYRNLEGAA